MASIADILRALPGQWSTLMRAARLIMAIRPGPGVTVEYRSNCIVIGASMRPVDATTTPQTKLIAKITGTSGCGFGYYTCDFYRASATVLDESTALTNTKLAVAAHKVGDGYCFNMQEVDASTNDLTDAANTMQLFFNVEICGPSSTDGKPVARLLGNAGWDVLCPT